MTKRKDPASFPLCDECQQRQVIGPRSTTRFCSETCRQRYHQRHYREIGRYRKATGLTHEMSCAHCGQTFVSIRSDAVYCSTKCRVSGHRGARRSASAGANS